MVSETVWLQKAYEQGRTAVIMNLKPVETGIQEILNIDFEFQNSQKFISVWLAFKNKSSTFFIFYYSSKQYLSQGCRFSFIGNLFSYANIQWYQDVLVSSDENIQDYYFLSKQLSFSVGGIQFSSSIVSLGKLWMENSYSQNQCRPSQDFFFLVNFLERQIKASRMQCVRKLGHIFYIVFILYKYINTKVQSHVSQNSYYIFYFYLNFETFIYKLRYFKTMFAGQTHQIPQSTGKRVYGLQTRKNQGFNLNWDQSNTLNSYQLKKGKGKQITGKVTGKGLEAPQSQQYYDEALERQKLQQLYEKLAYQNPDIPPEELQNYVFAEHSKKKMASQNQTPVGRREPIIQKQSMKDIMYSEPRSMEEKRAASRVR